MTPAFVCVVVNGRASVILLAECLALGDVSLKHLDNVKACYGSVYYRWVPCANALVLYSQRYMEIHETYVRYV